MDISEAGRRQPEVDERPARWTDYD